MKRPAVFLVTALSSFFCVIAYAEQLVATVATDTVAPRVIIKTEALVKGPTVTLGEIAKIEGGDADTLEQVEITTAPMPGNSRRVDAALIETRIRDAGLTDGDFELAGAKVVNTTTRSQTITGDDLAADLHEYILAKLPWDEENAFVQVSAPDIEITLPEGDVSFQWRPNPEYQYVGLGTFRGAVLVDGESKRNIMCRAEIDAYADVVIAAEDIPRGTLLSPANLVVEHRSLAKMPRGIFTSAEELIGHEAKTTLFPGAVITKRDVRPPKFVRRSEIVTIEVQSEDLVVRTRAKALMDAALGEPVTCEDLDTKQRIQGIVRQDGVVVIP